jgi:hypothetical protein
LDDVALPDEDICDAYFKTFLDLIKTAGYKRYACGVGMMLVLKYLIRSERRPSFLLKSGSQNSPLL